jgi:hypothetical protein
MTAHLYDPPPALPSDMWEVSREVFNASVHPLDVHPIPDVPVRGSSTWVLRGQRVAGRTVCMGKDYAGPPPFTIMRYFINPSVVHVKGP